MVLEGVEFVQLDIDDVRFENGCIVSLFDKTLNREFVQRGKKMGVFSSYTDIGDCWDIRPVNCQKSRRNAKCTSFKIRA